MSLPAKLISLYREQGLRGIWKEALGRIYERTDFVILRRDLAEPLAEARCSVPFILRRVGDGEIARFREMPAPFPRHYQYRHEYGQRHCYGAFVGDRIAALMWPLFEADNRRVVSPWRILWPDEARLSSIWADPEFRGTGLMDACLEKFAACLKGRGYRYLYASTWIGNESSIRLHRRRGFEVAGKATRYSFRCQKDGRGLYIREKIDRPPAAVTGPAADMPLPDTIP